jgi:negative regulator of sigma E activity
LSFLLARKSTQVHKSRVNRPWTHPLLPLAVTLAVVAAALASCNDKNKPQAAASQAASSDIWGARGAEEPAIPEISFKEPQDGYFKAYRKVKEAEKAKTPDQAVLCYREALACFQSVQTRFPDWKTSMVDARIKTTRACLNRASQSNTAARR